jgi:hypothetical protein
MADESGVGRAPEAGAVQVPFGIACQEGLCSGPYGVPHGQVHTGEGTKSLRGFE